MAKFYVFNHSSGRFLFDGNFNVVKEIKSDNDYPGSDDSVFFLNDYNLAEEKGFKIHKDLSKVCQALSKIKFDKDFVYDFALNRTKNLIRDAVSSDILILQAVNSIDELNKSINLLSKRIREWYSLYLPEVSERIDDHEHFVKLVSQSSKDELIASFKIQNSMGADLAERDVSIIVSLASQIVSLFELKEKTTAYVKESINLLCPNTAYYIGEVIVARMIAVAGGFKKLAGYPASTLQLLGAEKALFRFLKDHKYKSPKYGILYQHPFMAKHKPKDRGKIARTLANFMAMSLKIDLQNPVLDKAKLEIISKSLRKFEE